MKRIIIDLDNTITIHNGDTYSNKPVNEDVVNKMRFYKEQGYTITIFTARNMKTFSGNLGKINIHTLPIIIEWLNKNDVPFDEVIVGKPWCGTEGFYVDDRAIRPSEFINLSEKEIKDILGMEERNDHN
ncbi:capsular biosynthesis protein [Salmonella enterica]|nr:capsular biosynthesis protein [Salmonella enterica]EBV2375354.1 capsular biosynthesis protein [Salmonella enterica subsp. enterica serovar Enteritidis]ECC1576551.1 capsular biosynthesis protein [Salmonella enterica subsp. diarizonae]ECS6774549.1 capsular biosynthesis protein [Salmonella enterica subsp. diarizonae serovar 65:z10:e,n,x,z15]ECV5253177.1 capsular biosynthesis protein [Salmonella enterica subsp. enterica]EDN2305335.1 capsular biosynthesis protein [Salmonella enterica subsp. diar